MNTFFISPLIPLKLYIIIQKEKNNILWNQDELNFISNINQLFNYNNILSEETKNIIIKIIDKVSKYSEKYKEINDELIFVNHLSFIELTNYNYIYYKLLRDRNYTQIINPYLENEINITIGLSDTGSYTIKESKFKLLTSEEEKYAYINDIIDNYDNNSKNIVHYIMSKSRIDSKINTITKILSNKSILYNLLEKESFIPFSDTFDIANDDNVLTELLTNFKKNIKSNYFVIKPSEGTLSDGVGIFKIDRLDLNFIKSWINNPDNNKYSTTTFYNSWILSEFIQSFLWKLNGQNNTSKVFPSLALKEPNLNIEFNDQIGRINKFRFWALYTIIDNEFTSYLYKDGYCEIALEELTNYSKRQLDPADIDKFYQEILGVENEEDDDIILEKINKDPNYNSTDIDKKIEAAFIGTYLDFARVVNENNFPLGADTWNNTVIPNMYNIVNILSSKMKRLMNCLNKYSLKGSKGCYSFFCFRYYFR